MGKKIFFLFLSLGFLLVFSIVDFGYAFAESEEQLITPDQEINRQIQGKDITSIAFFGFKPDRDGLKVLPVLKPGWTWLAAKNVRYRDKNVSFFWYNGYIYTNSDLKSNFRCRKSKREVSHLVKSNSFHIAFQSDSGKDSELLIFIASPEGKQVEITIDKSLVGVEKRLVYNLNAGEAKFIRIASAADRPEWTPMYFRQEKALRKKVSLNSEWKFCKGDVLNAQLQTTGDARWESVTLPHSWNATDIFDNRNFNDGLDIYSSYWRGICWYRKRFGLSEEYKGKRIFVEFEAANQVADAWLNGVYLGKHIGGYLGFHFDVSDIVRFDEQNLLAVRVDNRYNYDIPPHIADFDMMGGITRDVRLNVTENVSVNSIKITTPDVTRKDALVKVVTEIRNDFNVAMDIMLVTNIVDADGFIVASIESAGAVEKNSMQMFQQQSGTISYPKLWSPYEPYLYTIYSNVYVGDSLIDVFESPLGFRWFEFDAQEGFFLNGEYLKLRGVNLHQDRFGMGSAVPDSLRVKDIGLLKDMGINFVRLAHYPHDPCILDECDRLGIIVWEEIPYVNTTGRKKFLENTKNMMLEMIHRDQNHPSVVFWGIGNEMAMGSLTKTEVPYIKRTLMALNDIAHKEDPTRFTVQAHNDVIDPSIIKITDVIGFNRYFGWYTGTFDDFGKVMDEIHREQPDLKILISEYGAGAKRGYHVEEPKRFDFSEEYQLLFHEEYLKQINERPWIGGSAVWNGFDFASQAKTGNIPRINEKGIIDYKRIPKDTYYFYRSQWTEKPMIYIVSHTWKYRKGTEGEKKSVRVLSNCDAVELFLDGKSLGNRRKQRGFNWEVKFHSGENQLCAVGKKNGFAVTDGLRIFYEVVE